ncbi:hypothetical protein PGB90_009686 [Kerria lacca]
MSNQNFDCCHLNDECLNTDRKTVKFFEITGRTFVYPITYHMYEFQKKIIITAIFNNTLISVPSGLGENFLAAVIAFNFHRWFLNGKIVILSQTRNYLINQMMAYNSYTTLSDEIFAELLTNALENDCVSAFEKSIVLTSPKKYLNCLNKKICKFHNLILLIIFENAKIIKCQDYKAIMDRISGCKFRLLVFLDPIGFNSKTLKQVIEVFNISKLELKNVNSTEIKECTFFSNIESIATEISSQINNIKDSFFGVLEKYCKKLKNAKVISGNVASLSKGQIQKSKERFLKNSQNLSKAMQDDLLNSINMCSFLCSGIELLHNWGIRIFHKYLFDNQKDDELKLLITKDELLTNQMKLLNEYLKIHGSKALDDVIDDINCTFQEFPSFIKYRCIKTKEKFLSKDSKHLEVLKNFVNGIINVLVISNVTEEIIKLKTDLLISLQPIKSLIKLSDPRFYEGPQKCIFILTKGSEYAKFETIFNEKRQEQKSIDINDINEARNESSLLFPEGFSPEFECTSISSEKKNRKNSPEQKSLLDFVKPKLELPLTAKKSSDFGSPSLFEDDSFVKIHDSVYDTDFTGNDYLYHIPTFTKYEPVHETTSTEKDSFDDLILDLPESIFDIKNKNKSLYKEITNGENVNSVSYKSKTSESKFCDECLPARKLESSSDINCNKEYKQNQSKNCSINLTELQNESFVDFLFEEDVCDIENKIRCNKHKSKTMSSKIKCSTSLTNVKTKRINDFLLTNGSQLKTTNSDLMNLEQNIINNNFYKQDIVIQTDSIKRDEISVSLTDSKNQNFSNVLISNNSLSKKGNNYSPHCKDTNFCNFHKESEYFLGEKCYNERNISKNCKDIQKGNCTDLVALHNTSTSKKKNNELFVVSNVHNIVNLNYELFTADLENNHSNKKKEIILKESDFTFLPDKKTKSNCRKNESSVLISQLSSSTYDTDCSLLPKSVVFRASTNEKIHNIDEQYEKNLIKISSEMLNDCIAENVSKQKFCSNSVYRKINSSFEITSPVLFSPKKSSRNRSMMSIYNNKSSSINFDSFFDISEENIQHINHLTSPCCKENMQMKQSTPILPSNTYKFNLISFDNKDDNDDNDDIFLNDTRNYKKNSKKIKKSMEDANQLKQNFPISCIDSSQENNLTKSKIFLETKKNGQSKYFESHSHKIKNNRKNKLFGNSAFEDSDLIFEKSNSEGNQHLISFPSEFAQNNEKKNKLFSNFTAWIEPKVGINEKLNNSKIASKNNNDKIKRSPIIYGSESESNDNFPWEKKSPLVKECIQITPDFKKSSSIIKYKQMPEINTTPVLPVKRKSKKRFTSKKNLVEQFIDAEAEVTEDEQDTSTDSCSHVSDDSFINDEIIEKPSNIRNYLNSLKSPKNEIGKFHIPVLSKSKLKMNVFSQIDDYEKTYQNDSFCVDENDSEPENNVYVPSILTQMEKRLDERKRNKSKLKSKQFKRIRIIEDSSPDSPNVSNKIRKQLISNMSKRTLITIIYMLLMVDLIVLNASATAPLRRMSVLNGSIYGKRSSEMDIATSKTLRAMCDITLDACSEWFPNETK